MRGKSKAERARLEVVRVALGARGLHRPRELDRPLPALAVVRAHHRSLRAARQRRRPHRLQLRLPKQTQTAPQNHIEMPPLTHARRHATEASSTRPVAEE